MLKQLLKERTSIIAIAFLLGGCIATIAASSSEFQAAQRADRQRFRQLAQKLRREVHDRVEIYRYGLHGLSSVFATNQQVTRNRFTEAFRSWDLTEDFPGALGMGYIARVSSDPQEFREFIETTRADGCPDFKVHLPPDSAPLDDSKIDDRMIVQYVLPDEDNHAAIGLSIGAHPVRRIAAEHAMVSGRATITGRIQLVQDNRSRPGFLLLLPVYESGWKAATIQQRINSLMGWVYMPLIADQVFVGATNVVSHELELTLYNGAPAVENAIYSSGDHFIGLDNQGAQLPYGETASTTLLSVGSRDWYASIRQSPKFVRASRALAWSIGAGGTITTLLLTCLLLSQGKAVNRAQQIADGMTEELRRLATVAQLTTNGVIITDANRKIVWTNAGFTRITGYDSDDVIGLNPGHFLQCRNTLFATQRKLREAVRAGKPFHGEILNRAKGGREYWIQLEIQPLHDAAGELTGFIAIESDITDRKEKTELLRQASERTELALAGGQLGSWDWDIATGDVLNDSRSAEIVGEKQGFTEQMSEWKSRVHPNDLPDVMIALEQHLHGAVANYQQQYRLRHNDGTYRWVLASGRVVSRNKDDQPLRMVGTHMDITDRVAAVERARSMANVLQEAPNEIFIFDAETLQFVEVNHGACEQLGYTRDELLSMSPIDIKPQFELAEFRRKIAPLDEGATHKFQFETTHRRKDGTDCPVQICLHRTCFEQRDVYVAFVTDLTERLRLEQQLAQSQKLESIGQLAAGIAHEINTPMQCVVTNVEYLSESCVNLFRLTDAHRASLYAPKESWSDRKKNLEEMEAKYKYDNLRENSLEAIVELAEAATRVVEVVRAMKSMAHPGTSEKTWLDINEMIRNAVMVSKNRWRYCAELEMQLDETLPCVPMLSSQMNQVLLNMLVNSADAIADRQEAEESNSLGKITIATWQESDGIRLRISDTGCGMPDEIRQRVFDPFFTTKDVGKGTGQGLAISYDVIVQKHQGRIDIESTVGEGTTFTIWLPNQIAEIPMDDSATWGGAEPLEV